LSALNVLSFRRFIESKTTNDEFQREARMYLDVVNGRVHATSQFIEHLKDIANNYTRPFGSGLVNSSANLNKVTIGRRKIAKR
jgi:hypothetical protein